MDVSEIELTMENARAAYRLGMITFIEYTEIIEECRQQLADIKNNRGNGRDTK